VITPNISLTGFSVCVDGVSSSSRGRARSVTLAAAVERLEREMIEGALQRTAGNISQTARSLGLTRRGL
jgi:ActR/RegA family two-component response regulator